MLNRWLRSLSVRVWVTSVAALAVSLAVLAAVVAYAFNHFPEQMLGRHEQIENAVKIADGLKFDASGRPVSIRLPDKTAWLFEVVPAELKYRVLDAQGNVLLSSDSAEHDTPWSVADLETIAGGVQRVHIDGKPYDIMTLRVPHGNAVLYVQTAMSTRLLNAIISQKITPIQIIVPVTILVAMVTFGLTLTFTVYCVLRPLREASKAAASITPRNLKTRLSLSGIPSEISPLIRAFNDALGRLENGFSVQQQFLASAAHELQTPLTLIRGQIELQPDIEDKDLLLREIDMMARQVRQLLHLAEVSESQNFAFGNVNSLDVAQDVVAYLSRKADARQIKLELDSAGNGPSIWADRSALFILIKNILENAINVTPAYSTVSVLVDDVSVQIRDEGPGIKEEYLPFLFKRFWRAPDSRHDGAGLGLAICKEIALAHDWRLSVSRLRVGTCFVVRFC
ncbi:signal transduction histidine kinase [Paraburkholderia sp. WC7.3g]